MAYSIRDIIFNQNNTITALPIGGASSLTVYQQIHNDVLSPTALAVDVSAGFTQALSITVQSATALTVARTGTNYAFQVDTNTENSATGVKVTAAAAGGGAAIAVISSGANEDLVLNAKGSGQINLNNSATGNIVSNRTTQVVVQSTTALGVGRTTDYAFLVDTNTAASATGVKITAAAAAAGVAIAAISTGVNENLTIDAKGSGTVSINATGTGNILLSRPVVVTGNITPDGTGTRDIGTTTLRFLTIYVSTVADGANASLLASSGTAMRHGFGTDWLSQVFYIGGAQKLTLDATTLTLADAVNIVLNTTTGTKIGTATTQLLGFYNATPIAQRSGAAQAAVATTAATQTTPWGYSTQAQADAIVTLVNELRAWAVAQGFIKGSV